MTNDAVPPPLPDEPPEIPSQDDWEIEAFDDDEGVEVLLSRGYDGLQDRSFYRAFSTEQRRLKESESVVDDGYRLRETGVTFDQLAVLLEDWEDGVPLRPRSKTHKHPNGATESVEEWRNRVRRERAGKDRAYHADVSDGRLVVDRGRTRVPIVTARFMNDSMAAAAVKRAIAQVQSMANSGAPIEEVDAELRRIVLDEEQSGLRIYRAGLREVSGYSAHQSADVESPMPSVGVDGRKMIAIAVAGIIVAVALLLRFA